MLTKNDLQQIRIVVQEEVKSELEPVREDIKVLQKDVRHVKQKLNRVAKDVSYIAKDYDQRIVANTRAIEKLNQPN